MKQIFSTEGNRRLRSAWILLALSIAMSAALVGGTQAYLEKERRDAAGSSRRLQEARVRVDNLRRERESLDESAAIFRTLLSRGLMQPERRLDLVELINGLRVEHRIASVDYEIAPQRVLPIAGPRTFSAVDSVSSRVTLKVRALHEGDLLGFVEALRESQQGFHPIDRCHFKRIDGIGGAQQPRIEMDCTFEWITMKEKRA